MWINLRDDEIATLRDVNRAAKIATLNLVNCDAFFERLDTEIKENASATHQAFRKTCDETFTRDGELEMDEGAIVSLGDDPGAYVMTWRWIENDEAGVTEPEDAV